MLGQLISNALKVLKKNPVIILLYFAYMVFAIVVMFLLTRYLLPQNYYNTSDPTEALTMLAKLMLFMFLMLVIFGGTGLLFISGFGNMISEAVVTGKTSMESFFPGIRKFFSRVLLAALLFFAFCIGFGIVIGIISIPFTIIYSMGSLGTSGAPVKAPIVVTFTISIISGLITVGLMPLVELWFPALFISDLGPIKSLSKGVKSGISNYWKLLIITFVAYLPSFIYTLIMNLNVNNNNLGSTMTSPWYILMCIFSSVIGLIMVTMIFIIYNNVKLSESGIQK